MPAVLVKLILGILRGWEMELILFHFLNSNKTERNVTKHLTPIKILKKTFIFWMSYSH